MRPNPPACSRPARYACLIALWMPLVALPGAAMPLRAAFPAAERPHEALGEPAEDLTEDPAAGEDPQVEIAAARAALVPRLLGVASWCHKVGLFEERDKFWEEVLLLDPANIEAHKGLGHVRSTDGTWRESKRHVYKNRSTKALPEVPAKRAEAMKPFSERMIALARAAADPAVSETYLAAIVAIDPDDATLHEYRGDVRDGDRWVLPETVVAREQRARIRAVVKMSHDSAPPTQTEPLSATDPRPTFEWTTGLTTGSVRVFSTGPEEDARQLARTCTAAGTVLQALFGPEHKFPPRFTFYVLDPGQKDALLATFEVDDAERARMAQLEGTGLPRRQDVALWTDNKPRRLDMAVRQTLSFLLGRGVGLTSACGWVWEGFGLYLTREITGTRLTWFVSADASSATGDAAAMQVRLLAQDANWMNEALTMLSGPQSPRLADVMKRDLARLEVRDAVASYALAAYLIEGRPDLVTEIARRASRGEDPDKITRATLSMSTDELHTRLVRWLSERR